MTLPTPQTPLKIGTRGSPLALAQAYETLRRLAKAHDLPETAFEIVTIKVTGDMVQDRPLSQIGGKGLFTKEIEEALIAGTIDIAVHSMKDMPVEQPAGLVLDCYLPREDVRDAFVSPTLDAIAALPQGATVGTSSLRRRSQLLYRRPDLVVVEFRGNVQTRLRKLADGVASATFLATAGLNRLGMDDVPHRPIDPSDMLPAIAQGAIGIERRGSDTVTGVLLEPIHHVETGQQLMAERAFLAALDGSCQTPIAGLATLRDGRVHLHGEILRTDGTEALSDTASALVEDGAELARAMAAGLLKRAGTNFFDWR